jgi:PAS domain S-box-containing protein
MPDTSEHPLNLPLQAENEALRRRIALLEQQVEQLTARQPEPDHANREQAYQQPQQTIEQNRLYALLDQLPAFVYLLKPDYTVQFTNRYFRQRFGNIQETKCQEPCHQLLFGRVIPCEECPAFRIFHDQTPQTWEATLNDGRTYQISAYSFTDSDGSPLALVFGIDMTERKQTEEELRNQKMLLQAFLDYAPAAIFVKDIDGTMLKVNHKFGSLMGFSSHHIEGRSQEDLFPQKLVERWKAEDAQIIASGEPFTIEEQTLLAHTIQNHSIVKFPIYHANGSIHAIGGISNDITARVQAEEAYHNLVDHSLQGLAILQDEQVVFANAAMTNITGYTVEELLAFSFDTLLQMVAEEDRATIRQNIQNTLAQQSSSSHYEYRTIRKDGRVVWVEVFSSLIHYRSKPAIQAAFIDITQRKHMEQALQESHEELERRVKERTAELSHINHALQKEIAERKRTAENLEHYLALLQATLESVSDGIGVIGNDEQMVLYNKRFEEIWNLPRDWHTMPSQYERMNLIIDQIKDPETFWKRVEQFNTNPEMDTYDLIELNDGRILERFSTPYRVGGTIAGRLSSFRDITERIQMERRLRKSEQRYRAIVENQIELIDRFQPDGTLTFVNEALCQYYGKPRTALLNQNILTNIPPEEQQRLQEHLATLTPDNPVGTIEHRATNRNGELRWQQWSNRAIFDTAGKVIEYQGVGRDITEQKRMEEALRNAHDELEQRVQERTAELLEINQALQNEIAERKYMEQAYHDLVEHSLQGVSIFQDEQAVFANQAFADICGITIQEVLALSPEGISQHIHPDDRTRIWQNIRDRLAGKPIPQRYEVRLIRADGEIRWVEIFGSRIHYRGRTAAQATFIDITERKRAEMALAAEQERFRWVVEHAEDGYIILNQDDTIRYANHQARLYLHLPVIQQNEPQEALTLPFQQIVDEHFDCHPYEAWQTWPHPPKKSPAPDQKKHIIRYLVRPESASAHALWLQVETLDLPTGADTLQLVRLRDITEQMSRQRQMWTFHALISHKINTPLSSMINGLYLLVDPANDRIPNDLKEFAHIALESAQHLHTQLRRIRHFLTISDLAPPGKQCPLVSLPDLINQIAQEVGLEDIRIIGFEQPVYDCLVLSRQAIELIVRQILENARKFHPNGSPQVDILLMHHDHQQAIITFQDDGITLSPEQLEKVWVPYYQGEKDFSGQVPGMGLGLAIVATLLWNVGGRYHIRNRAAATGIVIELCIPVVQA